MKITKLKDYKQQSSIEDLLAQVEEKIQNMEYSEERIPIMKESIRRINNHLYDVTSMRSLVGALRNQLTIDTENRSLRRTAKAAKVSHTYLKKFREGAPVCMEIMNRLANYYPISYILGNYDPDIVKGAVWLVEDDPE